LCQDPTAFASLDLHQRSENKCQDVAWWMHFVRDWLQSRHTRQRLGPRVRTVCQLRIASSSPSSSSPSFFVAIPVAVDAATVAVYRRRSRRPPSSAVVCRDRPSRLRRCRRSHRNPVRFLAIHSHNSLSPSRMRYNLLHTLLSCHRVAASTGSLSQHVGLMIRLCTWPFEAAKQ
jgi:hypothetical protein